MAKIVLALTPALAVGNVTVRSVEDGGFESWLGAGTTFWIELPIGRA